MQVRLLRGIIVALTGFAINDFEALSLGTVTDLVLGVSLNGGCRWDATIFGQR